ncbi:hypothetical protein [Nonomuraea sp. NPDC050310]|uniref:hypothetical protein n=1 Tax=Nonomuraea sp. NPDC050310 TaxID=3154935 RepID=UPI0033D3028F
MNSTTAARLDALRGGQPPVNHTARTLVGLSANPGCSRRALLDACGADKGKVARQAGYPWPFGQSPFALSRGNAFERQVKEHGGARLLALLRESLGLPIEQVAYIPLESVGDNANRELRYRRTRQVLAHAARGGSSPGILYDHPMLRLAVGGQLVYLEPDVIAFKIGDKFHVVEIKSFPVIDRQADGTQVAAATRQAAVYVIALRELFADAGLDPDLVAASIFLVTPKNFGNTPIATLIDARKQIAMMTTQLARMDRIETLVKLLPAQVSFDLAVDAAGVARRPQAQLAGDLRQVPARYRPECLDHCELAGLCRAEARQDDSLDVYGPGVADVLGGIGTAQTALALAEGQRIPSADQTDVARALRHAERLRTELAAGAELAGGAA